MIPSHYTRDPGKTQAGLAFYRRWEYHGSKYKEGSYMSIIPTPAQAMELVGRYNKEEFHLHHAKTVGWVLGCLAQSHDPGREAFWAVACSWRR